MLVLTLPGLIDLGYQPGVGANRGKGVETVRVADAPGDHCADDGADAGGRGDDLVGVGLGVEVGCTLVEVVDLFGQCLGLFGFDGDARAADGAPHQASYCGCFGWSSTAIWKLTFVPSTLVTVTVTP